MHYYKKKFAPFADKEVYHCKFCDFPISNPGLYPGKKLMVNRYCPKCHSVNSYPLLNKQDQGFLRAGFFSNPLYPFIGHQVRGIPQRITFVFYPFGVFFNFVLNIIYMPVGLIKNNVEIKKAKRTFYQNFANQDTKTIYFDMLRKRAAENNPYAAYILGLSYLEGINVTANFEFALQYLTIAKDDYEEELVALAKRMLKERTPDYAKVFPIISLVPENPQASYFLAYLYFYGYGTTPSIQKAKFYAAKAKDLRIKDSYLIFAKIFK